MRVARRQSIGAESWAANCWGSGIPDGAGGQRCESSGIWSGRHGQTKEGFTAITNQTNRGVVGEGGPLAVGEGEKGGGTDEGKDTRKGVEPELSGSTRICGKIHFVQ